MLFFADFSYILFSVSFRFGFGFLLFVLLLLCAFFTMFFTRSRFVHDSPPLGSWFGCRRLLPIGCFGSLVRALRRFVRVAVAVAAAAAALVVGVGVVIVILAARVSVRYTFRRLAPR